MPDQNDQQNPPQAQPAPSVPTIPTNTTVIAAESGLKTTIKELWGKYSIFFIFVGIVLLIVKFNSLAMDFIAWLSKREITQAQKEDSKLKSEEDALNKQADDLVKKANDLPNQEGPVDENWNKKH